MDQSGFFKKIIIGLSVISLALFGVIYFVYAEIKSKNQKIATVEYDLSQKNNRYDYLLSMQKLVSDIEPDLEKINESIVSKTGDVEFIESLESLARRYDLTIDIDSLNIVVDPKADPNLPGTFKIKAKTSGSWSSSYLFLSELESLTFKVKIDKFALETTEDMSPEAVKSTVQKPWRTSFEISVLKYN